MFTICPNHECHQRYKIKPERIGTRARCKKCNQNFILKEHTNGQAPDTSGSIKDNNGELFRVFNFFNELPNNIEAHYKIIRKLLKSKVIDDFQFRFLQTDLLQLSSVSINFGSTIAAINMVKKRV